MSFTHFPCVGSHVKPATHCVLSLQLVRHAPISQTNGVQSAVALLGAQAAPASLHTDGPCAVCVSTHALGAH